MSHRCHVQGCTWICKAVLLPHAQPLVSKLKLLAYKSISRPVNSVFTSCCLPPIFRFCRCTPLVHCAPPAACPRPCRSKIILVRNKAENHQSARNSSTMTSNKEPRIGVGVFVMNAEGKFILGKRKGSHGASESSPFLARNLPASSIPA